MRLHPAGQNQEDAKRSSFNPLDADKLELNKSPTKTQKDDVLQQEHRY
jgi:hypothetical protein